MAGSVTPGQVYQEVLRQGGSQVQAQVAAALVDGIESGGQLRTIRTRPRQRVVCSSSFDTTWGNYDGIGHAGDASFQQQVGKFLQESAGNNFYAWAPDLGGSYDGSGTYTQIGGKVASTISANATSWGAAAPATGVGSMTAADWTALYQASQEPGGAAYLRAANAANQAASTTGTGAATPSAAAAGPTVTESIPGYGNVGATGQQASALDTIRGTLSAYGFTPDQTNQLTTWAWGEILAGTDATQVAIDLQTPGTTGYQVFEQQFPGFVSSNAALTAKGLPALSVKDYASYQTSAMQLAQAAGLPTGFINSQNIGTLVANNVSIAELTSRVNNAMVLAYQSTPEQRATFNQYFGANYANDPFWGQPTHGPSGPMTPADWQALQAAAAQPGGAAYLRSAAAAGNVTAPTGTGGLTPGQIAAIALDPNVAEPLIAQQIQAAQIGGASVTSGVGALDVHTATQLAQAGITTERATTAFQALAPYSALETARPGMGGEAAQGVVTPEQLATGQLLGNPQAQRQLQTALEVAKAPFTGGGGPVQTSKGAVGAGSSSSQGAGGT